MVTLKHFRFLLQKKNKNTCTRVVKSNIKNCFTSFNFNVTIAKTEEVLKQRVIKRDFLSETSHQQLS